MSRQDRIEDYPLLAQRVVRLADTIENERKELLEAELRADSEAIEVCSIRIDTMKRWIQAIRQEVSVTPLPPGMRPA